MDALIQRLGSAFLDSELPTQSAVLNRLDDCIALVIGDKIDDYESLEQQMVSFIETVIDCGVIFVISEKSKGFLKYLMSKNYRVAIMTPGEEIDFIKKRAWAVFILVASAGASSIKLKAMCEDCGITSQLYVTNNPMFKTRFV